MEPTKDLNARWSENNLDMQRMRVRGWSKRYPIQTVLDKNAKSKQRLNENDIIQVILQAPLNPAHINGLLKLVVSNNSPRELLLHSINLISCTKQTSSHVLDWAIFIIEQFPQETEQTLAEIPYSWIDSRKRALTYDADSNPIQMNQIISRLWPGMVGEYRNSDNFSYDAAVHLMFFQRYLDYSLLDVSEEDKHFLMEVSQKMSSRFIEKLDQKFLDERLSFTAAMRKLGLDQIVENTRARKVDLGVPKAKPKM